MPKETKAERLARQEIERLEGVLSRRAAKHEDAKQKLSAAKTRQKDVKKKAKKATTKKATTKSKSKKK